MKKKTKNYFEELNKEFHNYLRSFFFYFFFFFTKNQKLYLDPFTLNFLDCSENKNYST